MTQDETSAENAIVAEVVETVETARPRPWGFWATMAFSLVVIGLFVALQTVVTIGFVVIKYAANRNFSEDDFMRLASSGLLLSVAEWVSAPLTLAMVVLLVKLRRQLSVRQYLSLNRVPAKTYLVWTAIVLVYVVVSDGASWILGKSIVPEVMIEAYRTAVVPPLLWGAIIVAAPVFEELFFRGFFFRGIQQSRLGNVGAVLITSFFWSIIHVQYSLPLIVWIFLLGILLGIARARSNSTYLTIALHALLNLIATIQVEMFLWE
ncbi:MAG: CPBP family intramembrane metalloprotease [Planctomycetes bacterium]|nr:CPBP family intramembrane metalloprotease [Planctomycetota bacterium]MBU4398734.1 CPBP family intramembrane metalloprotease [Planctomycetota bacterium]MCG2684768.1 CPBP family intramembrane metalloprotease [Planctomycetales bacterium]